MRVVRCLPHQMVFTAAKKHKNRTLATSIPANTTLCCKLNTTCCSGRRGSCCFSGAPTFYENCRLPSKESMVYRANHIFHHRGEIPSSAPRMGCEHNLYTILCPLSFSRPIANSVLCLLSTTSVQKCGMTLLKNAAW